MRYRGGWIGYTARYWSKHKGHNNNRSSGNGNGNGFEGLLLLIAMIVGIIVLFATHNIFIIGAAFFIILVIWALFS